jgi:uncharacterized protein (UPF0216 family)
MSFHYTIKRGECISTLACRHGFFPDTIWNDPANAGLREKRESPNTLLESDVVFIPDRRAASVTAATGRVHRFRRRGVPEVLRIRFLDSREQPRADVPFVLKVNDHVTEGRTDGEGFVVAFISQEALEGELEIGEGDDRETFELALGRLDPITEPSGIRSRLQNLGYGCGGEPGDLGEQGRSALRCFQGDRGLPQTGEPDEATLAELKRCHRS